MKRLSVFIALSIIMQACVHLPMTYEGKLVLRNCTNKAIVIKSGIDGPGYHNYLKEFQLDSNNYAKTVARTRLFSEEPVFTIDDFVTNGDNAYISIGCVDNDTITRTWKYSERAQSGKQFFDLEDYDYIERGRSERGPVEVAYVFHVTEDMLVGD